MIYLSRLELVNKVNDQVLLIRERLGKTQSRKSSYVYVRRRDIEFK